MAVRVIDLSELPEVKSILSVVSTNIYVLKACSIPWKRPLVSLPYLIHSSCLDSLDLGPCQLSVVLAEEYQDQIVELIVMM